MSEAIDALIKICNGYNQMINIILEDCQFGPDEEGVDEHYVIAFEHGPNRTREYANVWRDEGSEKWRAEW